MAEGGRIVLQRLEQLHLHAAVGDVILAADDVRDAELGVVDDAGEGVEERAVGADDDRVGQRADIDRLVAADEIVPRDDSRQRRQAVLGDWRGGNANAAYGLRPRAPRARLR